MTQSSSDGIERSLEELKLSWQKSEIQNGVQYRTSDGVIINLYYTGRCNLQGRQTAPSYVAIRQKLIDAGLLQGEGPSSGAGTVEGGPKFSNKVFIVYGHDLEAREQLELILRRMKLEPIILQHIPSEGQTIIEKLENQTEVNYGCVLVTPDDVGFPRNKSQEQRPRARQNVVLELGMLLAKLGRRRVAVLHKGNVELPSDINGLIYIPFNSHVNEAKDKLAAELQTAGFQISIKDLLG